MVNFLTICDEIEIISVGLRKERILCHDILYLYKYEPQREYGKT